MVLDIVSGFFTVNTVLLCFDILQLEERKESSQPSTLERQTSKDDSTEEEQPTTKLVENLSPKFEENSNLIENDESTVRYIQVKKSTVNRQIPNVRITQKSKLNNVSFLDAEVA